MVKFSKELEAHLIPEWKDAFVNYCQLKKCVKKIKISRTPKKIIIPQHNHPVRYFVKTISDKLRRFHVGNDKTEIIQVRRKSMADGSCSDDDEVYETELVQLFSDEDEVKVFFERLDYELNKVNQFYKTQESELLERGEILNNQLDILLDIKKIITDRRRKPNNAGVLPHSRSSSARNSDISDDSVKSSDTSISEDSQTDDITIYILNRLMKLVH
jgi:SPX domain protein involved in polyphosphate accumulation